MTFAQKKSKKKEELFTVWQGKKSQAETFRMNNVQREYNGWTNFTTWSVALNIDNEQGFKEDIFTGIKDGNINNGQELKEYFKQNLDDSGNYNEDYHSYKLSDAWSEREIDDDVNWYEIYESYKRDIKEEEDYQKKKEEM